MAMLQQNYKGGLFLMTLESTQSGWVAKSGRDTASMAECLYAFAPKPLPFYPYPDNRQPWNADNYYRQNQTICDQLAR
ncbi:MAG TPA: hypothetical protein VNR60_11900 [Croceibacterium sp.]|nr:hypothetical protein [Croceibacterium sp.]